MPIEPTESAITTGTDRRAFLTRTAAGGALVATVASTGLGGLGLGVAAAQEESAVPPTVMQEFAAMAAPLELAASVAYEAALAGDTLSQEQTTALRRFQRNHQTVAATLTENIHPDAASPIADPAVVAQFSPPAGADETSIVSLLAALEEALAATHLSAIASFDDSSFAKTISQVLAVEQQQAVILGRAGGASIESLTPATGSTDGALVPGQAAAPFGADSGTSDDASDSADSGNATDAGNETDTGDDDTSGSGGSNSGGGSTGSEGGTDSNLGSDANSADDQSAN